MSWHIYATVNGPGDFGGYANVGDNVVEDGDDLVFGFFLDDPRQSYQDIVWAAGGVYNGFSVNGYRPTQIIVDGVWVTTLQTLYMFENVHEDHTFEVTYSQDRVYVWHSGWFESVRHPGIIVDPPEVLKLLSIGDSLTATWRTSPGGEITTANWYEGDITTDFDPIPDPGTYTFANIQGDIGLNIEWNYTAPPLIQSFPWVGKFQLSHVP